MRQSTVFLVEDDRPVRESIAWMLQREGLHVQAHAAPSGLLKAFDPTRIGCLVLDLHLPEMNAFELLDRLAAMGCRLPFIIVTGHGEVPDATDAMRLGAVDFMEKPLCRETFLERVWQALDKSGRQRRRDMAHETVKAHIEALTTREREVLDLVVTGMLTKQIARKLNISVKTVEVHRSNITKKMRVRSVIQLVRMITEHELACAADL